MKNKSIIILSLLAIALLLYSCGAEGASLYGKQKRFENFMNTLPKDIAEKFDKESETYGERIKKWEAAADKWIAETFEKETNRQAMISNKYRKDPQMLAVGLLTNRFYERENPFELMAEVKEYSDSIAKDLDLAMKNDDKLRKEIEEIMVDEAIINFSNEQLTFYFLWNYVITFDRPRRFQ